MSDKVDTIDPPKTNAPTGGLDPSVTEVLNLLGGGGDNTAPVQPTGKSGDVKGGTDPGAEYDKELQIALPAIEAARKHAKVSPVATTALEEMEKAFNAAAVAGGKRQYDVASASLKTAVTQAKAATDERDKVRAAYLDEQTKLTARLDEARKQAAKLTTKPALITGELDGATVAQEAAKNAGEAMSEDWPTAKLRQGRFANAVQKLETDTPRVAAYQIDRAKFARKEPSVNKINDAKGPKKELKDAYLVEFNKVKAKLDVDDYEGAQKLLPALGLAIDAAFAARQKEIEKATKKQIDKATKSETSGLFGKTKVYEKPGTKAWNKMVDNILDVQLDPDFQEHYDTVCDQVADDIANDPIVINAKAQWDTWMLDPVANDVEIKKFMNRVVKLQCDRLGSDPPPVETKADPDPTTVGGFSPGTGKITLNPNSDSNQDFEELLDTLTHENTHAYQTLLINRLAGPVTLKNGTVLPKLKPGDPDYNAAAVLKLNDIPTGYIQPDDAKQYPGYDGDTNDPYEKQACEVQAYRAGARTGKAAYAKMK